MPMLGWWTVAAAQEVAPEPDPEQGPEADPEGPIVIAPLDEVLPSAIDSVETVREETKGDPGAMALATGLAGGLVRGKLFVRPVAGLAAHEGAAAVWLGGAVGHTWWTIEELPIQIGGETSLRASAPVGGARGYRLELATTAGPWLGPVGIRLGPALRIDREAWGADVLLPAASLGGSVDLSLDLGPFAVLAGVQPLWDLSDVRTPDPTGRWPAIGTDTAFRAGVAASVPLADLTAEVVDRVTPIGPVVEINLGLRLRLFNGGG